MSKTSTLTAELGTRISAVFAGRNYFACVYGSYATEEHTALSDLDFFIALEECTDSDMAAAKGLAFAFFEQHGLAIDNEVPFENKLVVTYADTQHAVQLDSFVVHGDSVEIPPIEKTAEFLASDAVRWRLILNALTTPHLFVAGSEDVYLNFRTQAEQALRILSGLLVGSGAAPEQKMQSLLVGKSGEEGEMYLGYKTDRKAVIRHLAGILAM